MSKPRKYDWPVLLAEFEQSGLSQTEFCAKHNINPKYFSVQRSKRLKPMSANFVELNPSISTAEHFEGLTLQVGDCKVLCPSSMPVPSLVSLIRALA